MKLLMISGDRTLAENKRGAFYNTLEEFHKYWERVDIICPPIFNFQFSIFNFLKPITYNLKPETYFNNVFIHPSPWSLVMQPWWILKKGSEIYREHKFNLITVHEYPPFYNGIGTRLLWNKIHVPYVLEIHHIPGYPKAADFKEWLYKIATRRFIKYDAAKAKAVRVVNQHQVTEFLVKAGVPSEKIKYIPSAYIDLEIFRPLPLEKKYDLIFIGRLTKNKGVNLLLETVRILNDPNSKFYIPNSKSIIVGDGPERKNLESGIWNLELEKNVILHGWAKDPQEIAQLLNQSKVLVMSSYNEGGPRVVLEAMACGVPIITTKVGLMPDIIRDGDNGLFTNWDSHQTADKILYLLKEPELQKKFSQAGLQLVRQFEKKYAIKNYVEKLQNLITKS